jgi:hypothetical protein
LQDRHVEKFFDFPAADLALAASSPMLSAVDEGKEDGAVLIAASIVAAIRLRGIEIERTAKVLSVIRTHFDQLWCTKQSSTHR